MKICSKDNIGLIIGLVFGLIIGPLLASLGLVSHFFEWIRPVLIGPIDWVGSLIPDIQKGPDSYSVPWYKWILTLGANGIFYAVLGWLIQYMISQFKK